MASGVLSSLAVSHSSLTSSIAISRVAKNPGRLVSRRKQSMSWSRFKGGSFSRRTDAKLFFPVTLRTNPI
eukprot:8573796-Pyramimonas_sp.AAC.1